MSDQISFIWNEEKLSLLPEKAILLPEHHTLLIADLHFGKTSHFRKNGLPIPAKSAVADFEALNQVIRRYNPEKVYFLGDLFHSEENQEWPFLIKLLASFTNTHFYLIPGNHDLVSIPNGSSTNFFIAEETVQLGNIFLCHDPAEVPKNQPSICGHIHPGHRLKGKGRQSVMLPAFYIRQELILMPAFGALTGLVTPDLPTSTSVAIVSPSGVLWVPKRKFGA